MYLWPKFPSFVNTRKISVVSQCPNGVCSIQILSEHFNGFKGNFSASL
jgi:hypothetical protein